MLGTVAGTGGWKLSDVVQASASESATWWAPWIGCSSEPPIISHTTRATTRMWSSSAARRGSGAERNRTPPTATIRATRRSGPRY
jgi:hypothetical protein